MLFIQGQGAGESQRGKVIWPKLAEDLLEKQAKSFCVAISCNNEIVLN